MIQNTRLYSQNLNLINSKRPTIKTEESPKFDYSSYSRDSALKYITENLIAHGKGTDVLSDAAQNILRESIKHHKITWNEVKYVVMDNGVTNPTVPIAKKAWDIIYN